jgi:hypothetical protein
MRNHAQSGPKHCSGVCRYVSKRSTYTGWCDQSWTKILVFPQSIGLHILLKLTVALESTVWCVLSCWLSIYAMLVSFLHFFWRAPGGNRMSGSSSNESADSRSNSAAMDACRAAIGLRCGLDFCLQNLNPPEDKFLGRICPMDPEDHMLSQKLLVDIRIYPFDSGN